MRADAEERLPPQLVNANQPRLLPGVEFEAGCLLLRQKLVQGKECATGVAKIPGHLSIDRLLRLRVRSPIFKNPELRKRPGVALLRFVQCSIVFDPRSLNPCPVQLCSRSLTLGFDRERLWFEFLRDLRFVVRCAEILWKKYATVGFYTHEANGPFCRRRRTRNRWR